jgi:hypothetical protein
VRDSARDPDVPTVALPAALLSPARLRPARSTQTVALKSVQAQHRLMSEVQPGRGGDLPGPSGRVGAARSRAAGGAGRARSVVRRALRCSSHAARHCQPASKRAAGEQRKARIAAPRPLWRRQRQADGSAAERAGHTRAPAAAWRPQTTSRAVAVAWSAASTEQRSAAASAVPRARRRWPAAIGGCSGLSLGRDPSREAR